MKRIIEVEIGFPKSIVQYEGEPITTMISTEQLQEELNLQLLQPDVIKSVCDNCERKQLYIKKQCYCGYCGDRLKT